MAARASSIIPFFAFRLLLLLLSVAAKDFLVVSQSLADGQSLISFSKIFELGFFAPSNSSNRYLGIWYHKIPVQTIVWVANQEAPLMDKSGLLTIQDDGNLALIDGRRNMLWSTNISGDGSGSNTTVSLMDNGNLVLYMVGKTSKTVWQSFDHPTDTLLPGMKIGFDRRTRRNRKLTSWRSTVDPAPGDFTYGLDPNDSYQFFIWNQSVRYWRSSAWNGRAFNRIPGASSEFLFHFSLVKNDEEAYFEYSALYNNTRLKMDPSGEIRCLLWFDVAQTWGAAWFAPSNQCGVYGSCGLNSICSDFEQPMCSCLPGYEPASPKGWSSGYWAGGCKRRTEVVCGMKHEFLAAGKLKVPDEENLVEAGSEEVCRDECSKNCGCSAYVFADMGGDGDSQCLLWYGNLVDVGNLKAAYGVEKIFLKVGKSELDSNKKVPPTIISAITIPAVLILGTFLYFLRMRKRKLKYKGTDVSGDLHMFSSISSRENVSAAIQLLHGTNSGEDVEDGVEIPFYSFISILLATNHFSKSNLLGEGGFGRVYKGILPGEREVAIKRLSTSSGQGIEEFKTEVKLIANLQHRNLVRLLGCCIEKNEKMLVYEYMPNKSLDSFIFDSSQCKLLDWEKRFNIILGIARGLLYLHQDSRLRIVHRDLKASNILLDEEMTPKISDFGMARIFQGNETQGNTRRVVGTYGYMSPEYALHGIFSVKSDVFSFGVLLIEIISGKKNNHFYHEEEYLSLLGYAWKLWNSEEELQLLEPQILESAIPWQVLRCIQLGLLCVQEDPADRPTMAAIISDLVSESVSLPPPKGPATYVRKYHCSQGDSNDLTITLMKGR